MVSTPLFLAMAMSIIASVPWDNTVSYSRVEGDSAIDGDGEMLVDSADACTDSIADGLMYGPPGFADAPEETGAKRRKRGLLQQVFTSVPF